MSDYLVFDLETQRSAMDVGGWDHIDEMKMSVGVLWDSAEGKFFVYYEDQVQELIAHLFKGPMVICYNHIGFDYRVLSGYYPMEERLATFEKFKEIKNQDLLLMIRDVIGKKIKLESAARPTLKVGKSADGLQALEWYKEYLAGEKKKLTMIADYCKQDVAVTRDLYIYGLENNQILYQDKDQGIQKIKVDWEYREEKPDPFADQEQLSLF